MLSVLAIFGLVLTVSATRLDVIGGKDVDFPGKYPWQVSLQLFGLHNCAGSIISDHWILTASHCIMFGVNQNSVLIGAHDVYTQEEGNPVSHPFTAVYLHPEFSLEPAEGYPNDIGLVYLDEPMDLAGNGFTRVIGMANDNDDFSNAECVISGWGLSSTDPIALPNILQEADVSEISIEDCRTSWGEPVKEFHICVGGDEERGACMGDSGGPLVCMQGGNFILAGATSWGHEIQRFPLFTPG